MLALRGVTKTGEDVFVREIREVAKNLIFSHARSEIGQHIIDSDPHATDARLSSAFARLDRDDAFVRHAQILPECRALPYSCPALDWRHG